MDLFLLTKLKASCKLYLFDLIIYAMTTVALLDIPAWQCTKTLSPFSILS
ncbi:124L [Invertebrate iridescent virus Kaz2018]|uniref:Uncharacterized protein n=1 Tax=Iridovirus sp. TaxID=135728 RepID=A0AAU7YBY1_9VIRU|nr:124L [Invertebrate iridescent virus Kaz2018]